MGTIAVQLFDDPNRELYDFAVCRLSEMLDELKARYYAGIPVLASLDNTPGASGHTFGARTRSNE